MHSLLVAIYIYFLSPLLTLLLFLIFAYVIMSWLVAFGVVSMRNQTVRQIQYALDSVMLPMLRPIQRYVPPLGQLDLSVFLLALGIMFTKDWLLPTIINMTAPSIGY
ncbi:YggT family protein [Hyphomonas sp.]|jgi:YggT family protein|uniref:YggT family protein n=1 Tax=Hyphomonas sp. TaxID=87 RepID=UPI000C4B265F|nr:YggT family protein [Hyphomonas sp.]MAU66111.1 YggT family protein [Hyphomonas sp.]MBM56410.1 YggT family protein [Hyphomonas sp.]|tara:strand:+ start:155 stop:475 length:321 start_codon:yes stop_codon:yes gene_type:complete